MIFIELKCTWHLPKLDHIVYETSMVKTLMYAFFAYNSLGTMEKTMTSHVEFLEGYSYSHKKHVVRV